MQTGSCLTFADICLRKEYEYTIGRLQQGRIAPTAVCCLGGQRKEALIAVGPFLHPPLGTLRNLIGRLLLVRQAIVTEGDTIIIQTHRQTDILTECQLILVGLVDAMQTLTCQHLIIGCDMMRLAHLLNL